MKYGQILMNSDRGAVKIIINFSPPFPPPILPHSSIPSGTPVASPTSLLGRGEEHLSKPTFSPFLPSIAPGKGPRVGAAWGWGGSGVQGLPHSAPGVPGRLFGGVPEPKPAHHHPQNPNRAPRGLQGRGESDTCPTSIRRGSPGGAGIPRGVLGGDTA